MRGRLDDGSAAHIREWIMAVWNPWSKEVVSANRRKGDERAIRHRKHKNIS